VRLSRAAHKHLPVMTEPATGADLC